MYYQNNKHSQQSCVCVCKHFACVCKLFRESGAHLNSKGYKIYTDYDALVLSHG